jgi:fatty-acyl-CoA synthase
MTANDHGATTLTAIFEKSLRKYRERTAVEVDGTAYTYGDLDERANAMANAFAERGIGPGDRVALLMANRLELVELVLAVQKAGAVMLPLNSMLTNDEYEYMLSDAGGKTIVCGPQFIDRLDAIRGSLPDIERLIAITDDDRELPDGFERYRALRESGAEDDPPAVAPAPDSVAGHFYTGGTTGKPKGVIISHEALTMNLFSHVMELDITGDDQLLLMTPLTHSAGVFLWAALVSGATVHVRSGFEPGLALSEIEEYSVTWTFMVPTMIYRVLDHDALDSTNTASLDTLVYGAAPMTTSRLREGIEAFGSIFTQFYGQTEVPNLITSMGKQEHRFAIEDEREDRLSSAGQACLMTDVKIVDPDSGEEIPTGEEGEIAVSAPYTLDEYHGLPEKTAETIRDGWVYTGDIGRIDEDGYVSLLDRKNNMIITGGMNVYSTNVEEALAEHSGVSEVAVIGVPDEKWGEAVTAIVVPKDETTMSEEDMKTFADSQLADYKKPKNVKFVDSLPQTPYGKIDKNALREPYWENEDRQVR